MRIRSPSSRAALKIRFSAVDVVKAVLAGELMTCVVLFTFTRLEGVPRSTPVIHALILGAGLATARAMAHLADRDRRLAERPPHVASEHIILIGLSDLSSLYLKVMETFAPGQKRIIALLDEAPDAIGRSIDGVRVFGPPSHLQSLIEEFAVHGISTDRVVVGGEANMLSEEALKEIERVCVQRNIELDFVPRLFGLSPPESEPGRAGIEPAPSRDALADFELPAYFRFKSLGDFFVALALVIALLPVWILLACLTFLDVGSPVLFWQQRLGRNGRQFLLHKFRTLRPPYDWRGRTLSDEQRLSWIGRLVRKARVDELPQL